MRRNARKWLRKRKNDEDGWERGIDKKETEKR